jgi:hypothetical protein
MASVPERFDDSLAARIFPHRFRRVGNPYAFLNDVGIVPILEYIYKGNLLIDVAEVLNVSFTILTTWVENEGHGDAIEEAQKVSAEGYLAEGYRRLRDATNDFELKRAKEMINHARFMASKKDKGQYGSNEQTGAADKAGVSYVFNIAGNVVQQTTTTPAEGDAQPPAGEVIEGQAVHINLLDKLDTDFASVFGIEPDPAPRPKAVPKPPVKAKGANKHALPVIGPFHD